MRTTQEIQTALASALRSYREGASRLPAPELRGLSDKVKDLQQELSAAYASGAKPCRICGNLPHGMERRPGVIEVGCLACLPKTITSNGRSVTERSPAAQGKTSQEAVTNWNAGKYRVE